MTIVAPTKHSSLLGAKLLVVDVRDGEQRRAVLAVDTVGAGVGDQVIVAIGSHAVGVAAPRAATDAVIVGIVEPPVTLTQDAEDVTQSRQEVTRTRRVPRRRTTPERKADG